MFETLVQLVKDHAGDAIINNPAIPNEKNDEAIQHASKSIVSGLQGELASGNAKDVISLLTGKSGIGQNPAVAKISGNVASGLAEKFGLNSSQAAGMVASLLPGVLGSLVNKTNDPNDKSIDLGGIFSSLTGGKTSGIDFGKMLDKDGDGSSMDDLAGMLSGGAKDAMKGQLGDMLGGLFGKKINLSTK
ncbi:MAG: DUF937 domain-containing protein [Bacteroidetes bacterium]|nr:DUF937 domain-containing protein [Bacteroidota bacterium]